MSPMVNIEHASLKNVSSAPIGLFDSGVGGLSVYMHLKEVLPSERYIYYADTLNVPYGPRSSDEISQLSMSAVDWLVAAGCKLIVIACNSASAYALKLARQKYPQIPIVGLVPALKPAVLNSMSKNVAVLATQATLEGELLNTVIKDYAIPANVNVIKWFNPDLVPWVEAGMPLDSDTARRLKHQLYTFAEQRVDHLVLGCTHYPFFRDFVLQEVSQQQLGITVVDSGAAIADRVKVLLDQQADSLLSHLSFTEDRLKHKSLSHESIKHNNAGLHVGYTVTKNERLITTDTLIEKNNNDVMAAQLSFFVSDSNADLDEVSTLVKRLIYPHPLTDKHAGEPDLINTNVINNSQNIPL